MFLCPIKTPVFVTQHFGVRPEVYKQFGTKGHSGIDFRAKVGTPLFAPLGGVAEVRDQGNGGYGLHIRIKNTEYECVIAHLSKANFNDMKEVRVGDPIGFSGNSGFSTAPHVHFSIRKLNKDGTIMDKGNGFAGYLDIEPFTIVWTNLLTDK